jgi:hypothetical protein
MRPRKVLAAPILTLLAAQLLLLPATGVAQEESPPVSVHWAYSAYFGTGWYRVEGDRDVFVVRMTPRWDMSEASLGDHGERTLGFHFKFPVSVGLDRFSYDDPLGAADLDNVSFLSVNPGLDIEIPVNPIWSLRPYASIGYGEAVDASDSAWSYWAGVKSRVSLPSDRLNWRLINDIGFVGYTPSQGPDDAMWTLMAGLEFDKPLGAPRDDGDQTLLHWYGTYTYFGDDLEFTGNPAIDTSITDQWDIGAAIGRRDSSIKIWFLHFDRLGLGYRRSSSGDLKGITFVFRSKFDN